MPLLPTLKLPLPTVAAVAALCVASYLLAAWTHPAPPLPTSSRLLPCNTRQPPAAPQSSSNATALDFSIHHGASDADAAVAPAAPQSSSNATALDFSIHHGTSDADAAVAPAAPQSSWNATALDFSIHHGASDADAAVAPAAPQSSSNATALDFSIHHGTSDADAAVAPAAPQSSWNATALDFSIHHGASDADAAVAGAPARSVPACGARYSEHTPCEGQPWSPRHPRKRLEYRERHCPRRAKQRLRCLVPAPAGYRAPLRWPQSRDAAWYANAPHEELVAEKGVQNWIRREGDVLRFPGGGTMFPHGAGRYVDDIAAAGVPVGAVGAVRTALDTGCGVASWGAYLLSRDVLTMSFAPKDTHKAQVLFALERGIPAMLGIMSTKRLPYPGRAFDMAHCSRCLIPWNKYNGLYMIEIDRVLRPGGYWILSGPPVNWENHFKGWKRAPEDLSSEQADIEAIAKKLCWTKVQQKGDIAVWQKPINHVSCKADDRNELGTLGFCNASQDPDAGWYVNMEECITPLPEVSGPGDVAGGEVKRWPERLTAPPPRIATGNLVGITVDAFYKDAELWRRRLDRYKSVSNGLAEKGRYRNLLDMNAGLGGFAAALIYDPVWVMNVVPTAADANTLGVIYERGLIGTYQDWCEAMSTYPRTYDLIHADSLFTMYKDRCEMEDILLEMDRILRPDGTVIFRDDVDYLVNIKNLADGMRWNSRIVDHEDGPMQREKILVAVKSYWTV